MGNITTDFITATKKIHADVRAILAALHLLGGDVKAIRDQGVSASDKPSSNQQAGDPNEKQANGISGGSKILDVYQSGGQKGSAKQETESYLHDFVNNAKRDFRKPRFVIELLALIGLLLYTCETRQTNNFTQQSLNLARDQYRPYVFTSILSLGDRAIQINQEKFFTVIMYNAGDAPAVGIRNNSPNIAIGGNEIENKVTRCEIGYPSEANMGRSCLPIRPEMGKVNFTRFHR